MTFVFLERSCHVLVLTAGSGLRVGCLVASTQHFLSQSTFLFRSIAHLSQPIHPHFFTFSRPQPESYSPRNEYNAPSISPEHMALSCLSLSASAGTRGYSGFGICSPSIHAPSQRRTSADGGYPPRCSQTRKPNKGQGRRVSSVCLGGMISTELFLDEDGRPTYAP